MTELQRRREKLFNLMKEGSVALLYCGHVKVSSEDEDLPLYPNSNFYYLTEISQEDSVLLLIKGAGTQATYLFVQPNDPNKVKWTGKRLTISEAKKISSIDNVLTLNNFEAILNLALVKDGNEYGEINTLYMDLSNELKVYEREGREPVFTKEVGKSLVNKFPHLELVNIYDMIVSLRMIKSDYEVSLIKAAIEKTNLGILHCLALAKPEMWEWHVADEFEFFGRSMDRTQLSFPSIVASGENATILHYPQQNDTLKENALLQFDVGYREKNYCADISRAYPLSGTFSDTQKKIYEAVLNCNKAVIEYIHPGLTLRELNDYTITFLTNECLRFKLISDPDEIKNYYYHSVSHHLGIDTHDASFRDKPLEAGNVITVEPGLYFKELACGVRIEDDVLITKVGCEVLSPTVKKEIKDIERLMSSKK
ncbi:MAG: Xaa-Pro peptidase family protein [Coprobacillus sp.]|nr:Xaa-Pro peptidase family protein [Coprobacillus sp.]